MRVLISGASGFIGRWAVAGLLRRGAEVVAVSRRPAAPAGARVLCADLLDPATIRRALADTQVDTLLHLAWNVEPGRFWTAGENLDWIAATMLLVRAAAEAGLSRVVGVGTCFEYAWPEGGLCDERTTPPGPTTLYAIAKDAVRRSLAGFAAERGLAFAWARPFHLYGPFEHPARIVPSVAISLARGRPALLSSGGAVRDFTDVRDAGDALAALALSDVTGEVNIASGRAATIAEIAGHLGRVAGRPELIALGARPDRRDDPPRIVAATRRLADEVGAPPPRSLEQGLAEAYAWWQSRIESVP